MCLRRVLRGGVRARGVFQAMPGLILEGDRHSGRQLAHTLFGFFLFWVLLVLMFFLVLAGLGAGGFPFGLGGWLRLVRPVVCFLSWIVLCCSCSLSSHCWEAICTRECQIHPSHLYSGKPTTECISVFNHCLRDRETETESSHLLFHCPNAAPTAARTGGLAEAKN